MPDLDMSAGSVVEAGGSAVLRECRFPVDGSQVILNWIVMAPLSARSAADDLPVVSMKSCDEVCGAGKDGFGNDCVFHEARGQEEGGFNRHGGFGG